jgi:uncharacterized protein (UPF0212 family)
MATMVVTAPSKKTAQGSVYCLICTHTVEAAVVVSGRKAFVKAGQKCPRCSSSLDPAYVLGVEGAA